MNEDHNKTFIHLSLTPEQVADLLNLKGQITRWWLEGAADRFHFVAQLDVPHGRFYHPGAYIEESNLIKETAIVRDAHDYPVKIDKYRIEDMQLFTRSTP